MKQSDTQMYEQFLSSQSTQKLEKLLAKILVVLRRRDSHHVKGDVVTKSRDLRKLR